MTEQEAIKTIKEAMYFIDGPGASFILSKMEEAHATLETCTVEQAKDAPWINVHDRLPDNARWVLGARRGDDVREMRYRRNWMQGYWDTPSIESPDPIYWREMPEPPKEETK